MPDTHERPADLRCIVTGHSPSGEAIILSDTRSPPTLKVPEANLELFELWRTFTAPAPIAADEQQAYDGPTPIMPPAGGTSFRVIDFKPVQPGLSPEQQAASFAATGNAQYSTFRAGQSHGMLHRTETCDFGVVLEGEIVYAMDQSEVTLHVGDVMVQQGTNHAWENRSTANCRMMFVLVDGKFSTDLMNLLSRR